MKLITTIRKIAKWLRRIPIILLIIVPLFFLSIILTGFDFSSEIKTAENTPKNIYQNLAVENMKELVEIKKADDNSGYYLDFIEDFDEKVEKIIEDTKNKLGLHTLPQKGAKQFIKKIIKAEVITQFPNLGGNVPAESNGFQGAIDIKRITPNKEIGSIDDNPGRGESTAIEKEVVYDTVAKNPSDEEKVKAWQSGQVLWTKDDAVVFEEEESQITPGTKTGYWYEKKKEGSLETIVIDRGTQATYTGKYEKSTNFLTNEITIYVEIETPNLTGFVRSNTLETEEDKKAREEKNLEEDSIAESSSQVSSRAPENSRNQTAGKEGESYTIAIAAGHNNTDNTGARKGSLIEEELTVRTAEKVEELLKTYSNITVVQTGSTSANRGGIKVGERTQLARNANPDLCIQIHFDAGGGSGVQAIYKEGDGISQQLADFLSAGMANSMSLPNKGAGADTERCAVGSLGIIENAATSGFPSVVTEGGFVDGEPDATLLKGNGTDLCAQGIVNGILEYLKADHNGYTASNIQNQNVQGSIESRVYSLKYVEPNQLDEYIEQGNLEALRVFTLDESRNLVTVTWNLNEDGSVELKKNAPMNFETPLQNYIMPYEYLLFFYINSNEKKFSEKLADEVLDTEIVVAIQDNVTTTKTIEVTSEKKEASMSEFNYEKQISSTTKVMEACTPKIEITYADAWCAKYYKESSYSSGILGMLNQSGDIIVNLKGNVKITSSNSTTGYNQVGDIQKADSGKDDEDGKDIMYTYKICQKTDTTQNTMSIQYDSGKAEFKGITNKFVKAFQDANMHNWIKNRYAKLYKIIGNNEKTANLLDLTKYLIYKATNNSWGVTEYSFAEFDISKFQAVGGIYGGSIQEKIWFALKDVGYSSIAAAGALGNIDLESGGFNTTAVNPTSGAMGLIQWLGGRADKLRQYAASKGVDWTDENAQIEFLVAEVSGQGPAAGIADRRRSGYILNEGIVSTHDDWKNATTLEDATLHFMRFFESPGTKTTYDRSGTWGPSRLDRAKMYYDQFKDMQKPSGDSRIGAINLSGENANKMLQMLNEAIRIADDDRYTYSQGNRYGEFQYDCSSFIARLYKAYFNFDAPSTTRQYGSAYLVGPIGSVEVQPGDVLWKPSHVEMYIGNGLQVGAHTDGIALADQISVESYNPGYFTHVYRFIQ